MDTKRINPFLDSAKMVLEQFVQASSTHGEIEVTELIYMEEHIWIEIELEGSLSGHILYGLHKPVALKIASSMMGGFQLDELDEMGKSAISELGNMISGNASSLLSNQGIQIDITPPRLIESEEQFSLRGSSVFVPIQLQEIGKIQLYMLVV
jgi:chemotaxis protein CheX